MAERIDRNTGKTGAGQKHQHLSTSECDSIPEDQKPCEHCKDIIVWDREPQNCEVHCRACGRLLHSPAPEGTKHD